MTGTYIYLFTRTHVYTHKDHVHACMHYMHTQSIASGVSFNLNLQSQSH